MAALKPVVDKAADREAFEFTRLNLSPEGRKAALDVLRTAERLKDEIRQRTAEDVERAMREMIEQRQRAEHRPQWVPKDRFDEQRLEALAAEQVRREHRLLVQEIERVRQKDLMAVLESEKLWQRQRVASEQDHAPETRAAEQSVEPRGAEPSQEARPERWGGVKSEFNAKGAEMRLSDRFDRAADAGMER